jgi:hypothetical protein
MPGQSVPIALVMDCRTTIVALLTVVLLGCGGSPPGPASSGFINHTQHSDAELQAIWAEAQQSVTEKIDLNPLQRVSHNVLPDIRPGNPRALEVEPDQLRVAAQPDVSSAVLLAATGEKRTDPTGLIACPQPCNVRYSTAYSLYHPELTNYAASWEFAGDNFSVILEYEFENHILSSLGYDMTWR